ncbi:DNA-directed RNA polymerase [Pusillimonas sp.]|uniref:DNA-directed RNA polymerase n=1 Tax=Pusillimonas sp. TaxID=3040095 RepID=UPI0037C7132D
MIQSQVELENAALQINREKIRQKFEQNESKGRANENAYAQPLYRRYVLALQDMIQGEVAEGLSRAGRRKAHIALLKPLDPLAAAFIAVRLTIVSLMTDTEPTARNLASVIGRGMHRELVLNVYEHIAPDLFYEVTHDLERRKSKSDRHRYNALMGAARNRGIRDSLPTWKQTDREQLGMWFIEALRVLGLIEVHRVREIGLSKVREVLRVNFTCEAERLIDRVKELVEVNTPILQPCIEPPKDWVAFNDGGWHTAGMRRLMPYCVNIRRVRNVDLLDQIKESDLSERVLPAINHLQRVRWAVNKEMLETVRDIARSSLDLEEVLSEKGPDAPERPEWWEPKGVEQKLTEAQEAEIKQWKRDMARWHTERKLRGQRWGRFKMATDIAQKFKDYEAIYFVYQADFRCRLYAQTIGLNPQGSDIQRALLHFADGKPLDTPDAVRWFKINGANRYGHDKVPFDDRIKWVDENDRHIIEFADDPVGHSDWVSADQPLQFLAWCKEYAAWRRQPNTFLSRIPVGLDGSCNGLQHFSAMLRDPVGGQATNLVASPKPNDIYDQVAKVTSEKLAALVETDLSDRDREFRRLWLRHGINRSLVKRSVMTLPYGSTRFSCSEFIVHDYLRHGLAIEFDPAQYTAAANFLSHIVWESIQEVVVAASAAMSWLQQCARTIIKSGAEQIRWTSPSGFPVVQVYNEKEEIQIRTKLFGGSRIKVHTEKDAPRQAGHKNGLAPNFVHSMDAAHLVLTVNACESEGINALAMIHDDYGTHAADTQRLYELIRKTFVGMYEKYDPISDFYRRYDGLPAPPKKGSLDLKQVLDSPYFFA